MDSESSKQRQRRNWGSFSLKTLFVLVTLATLFVAWRQHQYERGIVNRWVDAILADAKANPLVPEDWYPAPPVPCPDNISPQEQLRLVLKATGWLPDPERRTCLLKILAEIYPKEAHDSLVRIAANTKHAELKRQSILLASLYRNEKDLGQFAEYLNDDNPEIRAAAIDATGIICQPSFPVPAGAERFPSQVFFDSIPPIRLESVSNLVSGLEIPGVGRFIIKPQFEWKEIKDRLPVPAVTDQIRDMMMADPDANVRDAVARAMLNRTPDNYQLRVAEWGVWINEGENLTLAQSIIDEIPSFVHRTGDSVASIKNARTNSSILVTKPIIHITADQPMAVDLSVRIVGGRPWFGFPMPDDFSVDGTSGQFGPPAHVPDDVPIEMAFGNLQDTREGYPWILPSHTKHRLGTVTDIGFRWQSLIVLLEKAAWMELKPVTEKKYEWWSRLRAVPSSWVSNRGESERFLYYDGPTSFPSPVAATIHTDGIKVTVPSGFFFRTPVERVLFFIGVADGSVSGQDLFTTFAKETRNASMPIHDLSFHGEAVAERLTKILVMQGLTRDEAEGLVDCWRPQFFETNGRRLLTIFDKYEYDNLCPITVSPQPTEFARVGIVLTEFGDGR